VPLRRAVIESLRNTVELNLQNQAPRSANVRDTLAPGDALSTNRAALAQLRFNDGSLVRVGGQTLVRFVSETRTVQLSNGTLLLLVPPERGQTRIQTPNAVANVRGSALFIRYVPATEMTLIGALTESGIEVTNRDRSQTQLLQAGQIAVIAKNRIEQVYRFDLTTFYATSELVRGLNLQCMASGDRPETDQAIAAVRVQTVKAANTQTSLGTCNAMTAADEQSATNANVSGSNQASPLLNTPVEQQTENPSTTSLPANRLLAPPTASLPSAFPPTVALPTTIPLVNPPSAIEPAPPRLAEPPTLGGTPPGVAGVLPGRNGSLQPPPLSLPPGSTGTSPGLGFPPRQTGTPPGQAP
jgi:hypothetical protein